MSQWILINPFGITRCGCAAYACLLTSSPANRHTGCRRIPRTPESRGHVPYGDQPKVPPYTGSLSGHRP